MELAMNENGDCRELIPEAFFLPDMFMNKRDIGFGSTQEGKRVHHVDLPPWSNKNPYKFVSKMCEVLESSKVRELLGDWVDLIFGPKS